MNRASKTSKSTMNASLRFRALVFTLLVSSTVLASEGTDGVQSVLMADDLKVVQAGEIIYQQQCAACHGDLLQGQPNWRTRDEQGYLPAPPHDESGHTWHHADDLLFEITKYGAGVVIGDDSYKSRMPVYARILSDDEIIAALSFIKNTWPEEQRSWQDEVNGTQTTGITAIQKKPSLLDRLLK